MRTCSLCGGNYREWSRHFGSARHQRAMHPIRSRKGARATARRERRQVARSQLTKRYAVTMADEEEAWMRLDRRRSGRHYHGAWTPWGVPAFLGGRPGRSKKRTPAAIRRQLAKVRRIMRSL